MKKSQNNLQFKFLSLIQNQDTLSKIIFVSLGMASFGLICTIILQIIHRLQVPQLTIAAGDKTGESYIISTAIKEVVERRSNIKIKIKETEGSPKNIELLQQGQVELATAQVDVAVQEVGKVNQAKVPVKTVAILYKDLFQLVVKDPKINQFTQLRGKTIALPTNGGQYQSFLTVAEHYGMNRNDFKITGLDSRGNPIPGYDDQKADQDFIKRSDTVALFRVRALGNKSIAYLVNHHQGVLVPIFQAEAMKIKYPSFENAIIPQGAYKGEPSVPRTNLPTIALSRLLLSSEKVDEQLLQKLTRIIYEYRQEIANAIAQEQREIKPLIADINRPIDTSSGNIPLHPGALTFYERNQPSFIKANVDLLGFFLTVLALTFQWVRQIKIWIEKSKKDEADEYLKSAINLMKSGQENIEDRQNLLDDTFNQAAKALISEGISQESFRTFNEAYKTTREAIERDKKIIQSVIEHQQRENSARYIKVVVKLLQYRQRDQDLLLQKLDQILEQVVGDLVAEKISEESFRTFIEAYKATRDAIARN